MMTRIERVIDQYSCTVEDARRYIELRDEGHSQYDASVMAGLADPIVKPEDEAELAVTPEEEEAFNSMRGELR